MPVASSSRLPSEAAYTMQKHHQLPSAGTALQVPDVASRGDAKLQLARSQLRPVSFSSAMTSHSTSSSIASAQTSSSGASSETIGPLDIGATPPRPPRPTARRMQTTPATYTSPRGSGSQASHGASAITEEDERDVSEEGTDEEPTPEEHVVALHDFTSSNETCLSFRAGEVIRVFNRDSSGWWDGELDGERGWFPSNYVDEEGMAIGSPDPAAHSELSPDNSFGESESYHVAPASHESGYRVFGLRRSNSGSSSAGASTIRRPHVSTFVDPYRSGSGLGILEPIQHSIALLQNAVKAVRWAHFQPATACVISSVRSVLSATDCLTRESETLKAHPVLARERKQVLSELSRLVTQSRRASAVAADADPSPQDMQDMLRHASNVMNNSKRFIAVASECGVHVPDGPDSTPEERAESDKTPTPGSVRSSFVTARTSTNTNRRSLGLGSNVGGSSNGSHSAKGGRSPLLSAHEPPVPSAAGPSLSPGAKPSDRWLGPPEDGRKRADSTASTAESTATDNETASASLRSRNMSTAESLSDESQEQHSTVHTREEVLDRLKRAHEHLLSIVAAVVGHTHGHARDSHAASAAFLIDVTREAVDSVRNLLIVVEPVCDNNTLSSQWPREVSILSDAKDSLYEATSALVTAARILTSRSTSASGPGASPTIGSEDEEKSKLLAAATGLLRTGQECVGAVRMCLSKAEPSLQISMPMPSKAGAARDARAAAGERQEEEELEELEERAVQEGLRNGQPMPPATIRRGRNTLSFLGRKATSLSCLRQKYEQDAMAQSESAETSENEDAHWDLNHRRPPLPHHALTEPPTSVPMQSDLSGETSDASDAASRQHSRTSGSTMHSLHSSQTSLTTADNSSQVHGSAGSAKMDRRGTDASSRSAPFYDDRAQTTPTASAAINSNGGVMLANRRTSIESLISAPSYEPEDVCFNTDGQVTGATLPALVEKLTPHDTMVNAGFANAFFLCFRFFTTPLDLFDALVARFSMPTPPEIESHPEAMTRWVSSKVMPVRLRVLNFFKTWLELHWHASTDRTILEPLNDFISSSVTHALQRSGQRLAELVERRQTLTDSTKTTALQAGATRGPGSLKRLVGLDPAFQPGLIDISAMYLPSTFATSKGTGPAPPAPVVNKSLMASLRAMSPDSSNAPSVLDFDPLELARQLTIMESKIFCCILPDELLARVTWKKGSCLPPNASTGTHIKQMSALTTHITGWITESILSEEDPKRRAQLLKFFIKLGDRCLALQNYNALFAIQGALQASTISRLRKTWNFLSAKYVNLAEQQRHVIEHTRNFATYRSRVRSALCPALPFLGLFLTDLTFCDEGNADTRPSPLARGGKPHHLVNFDKYAKLSRIVAEVQRFQSPYSLVEVPEVQVWLERVALVKGKKTSGPEDLYRRSLWLEPRAATSTTLGVATLGASAGIAAAAAAGGAANGGSSPSEGGSMANGTNAGAATVNGGGTGGGSKGLQSLDLFNWAEGRRR